MGKGIQVGVLGMPACHRRNREQFPALGAHGVDRTGVSVGRQFDIALTRGTYSGLHASASRFPGMFNIREELIVALKLSGLKENLRGRAGMSLKRLAGLSPPV